MAASGLEAPQTPRSGPSTESQLEPQGSLASLLSLGLGRAYSDILDEYVDAGDKAPKPTRGVTNLLYIGMVIFFFLVVFLPLVTEATKQGAGTIPYVEATVIGTEALVSAICGMTLARAPVTPRLFLRYLPIGILRALKDIFCIVCLNYIDPSLSTAIGQISLVLTGILSKVLLKKELNSLQWLGLIFVTLSLLAFSWDYHGGADTTHTKYFGVVLALGAVLCKVASSVYCEKVLQEDSGIDVCLQTAAISCGTIVPTVVYAVIFDRERISAHGSVFFGWSWIVVGLVVNMLARNWLINIVVKHFSAVMKYLIYALALGGTYIAQLAIFGGQLQTMHVIQIVQIVVGVYTYAEGRSWVSKNAGIQVVPPQLQVSLAKVADPKVSVEQTRVSV